MTNSKYKNKYRIPSARLQTWNYRSNAAYFVTICAKNRTNYFGEIINQKMQLSELGQLANQFWMEIPNHFSFAKLGEFIIMPNHVHGIIIIDKNNVGRSDVTPQIERTVDTPNLGVSTNINSTTTNTDSNSSPSTNAATKKWKPESLGVIINQYKRIIIINARKIHSDFAWQPRYYDHIIRNANSHNRISEYIMNNPANWKNDEFTE